jgi:hypothetical protein
MKSIWDLMIQVWIKQETLSSDDSKEIIHQMGAYLGWYPLNALNTYNPKSSTQIVNEFYSEWHEWKAYINIVHD